MPLKDIIRNIVNKDLNMARTGVRDELQQRANAQIQELKPQVIQQTFQREEPANEPEDTQEEE